MPAVIFCSSADIDCGYFYGWCP